MKNFMVLGANTLQLPLINKVNEMGYHSVVVSPNPSEPGFEIAGTKIYANVADQEKILEYAKEYNIVGIITDQTDIAVRSVAYVSEKLGLPGIGYETACLFTDKYLMREKCKKLGIRTLEYKLTQSKEEAIDFFRSLNKEVILKPVDNQGSKGIYHIATEQQINDKYKEALAYSRSNRVLVEEFVTGREFIVEGMAFNGEFKNLIIGDTYYFDIPDVFSATQRIFPTNADANLLKKVDEYNKKLITGFGLKQGISHSELIMCGDDIILIETAARGGGVFISSDLISLSTGLCTEEFLIKIATGTLDSIPDVKSNLCSCCYMAFYLPVGTVSSIDGIDAVIDLPYTYRNNLKNIKLGMETKPYTDKTSRFFVIVNADTREQLNERIEYIRSILDNIKVETDNGIKTPIWR